MSENTNPTNKYGQYVPAGSYQNSSTEISITLNAKCEQTGGNVVVSTPLTFLATDAATIGDIENREGVLRVIPGNSSTPNTANKYGQYVPAGSYQNSSSDISITLNAKCEQTGGNVVTSPSLTFLATDAATISDIENREGTLQVINA